MSDAFEGLHVYATQFTALNNSGVDGYALLFANEKNQTLTVHIRAEGLEPNQVHVQHIHGFRTTPTPGARRSARTPTATASSNWPKGW